MCAPTCRLIFPRYLRLHADLGSEPMLTALRAHFREWHVIKKAQSMPFDVPSRPQRTSGTGSVTADQRRRDAVFEQPEVWVPSPPKSADARDRGSFDTSPEEYERDEVMERHWDMTFPSWKDTNSKSDIHVPT